MVTETEQEETVLNRSSTADLAARLDGLRRYLADHGLKGCVVPHEDEYQNEFLPPAHERLAWLTGFTGSAGTAVVLDREAAIFVDGRYILQVGGEVDTGLWEVRNISDLGPADWLTARMEEGDAIGFDPWLHTLAFRDKWAPALERTGARLAPMPENPIDSLWSDRPAVPSGAAVPHRREFAGEDSGDKRRRMAEQLATDGADAALITGLDSLAWLFNIRGTDVPFTPLVFARAILNVDGTARLFIDDDKLSAGMHEHLGPDVTVCPPASLEPDVQSLAEDGKRILIDPARTPLALVQAVEGAGGRLVKGSDPCIPAKAVKNETELEGARAAHHRDGLALVRFLAWLDSAWQAEHLDELIAAEQLFRFRAEGANFRGLSFETISGAGPDGAIVHYRVTPETSRPLNPDMLYLVDSGGQYLDGTTDVTRTIPIGTPTQEQKTQFTRVLKGHIAIARARFPEGTAGSQIDALARTALWETGLDYDHGTGHGVGSYLGVHEGPQRISKRGGDAALKPGMILSNEPGYYETESHGIRIESLVAVQKDDRIDAGDKSFLCFETLTLAPIDRRLIAPDLLTAEETAWLDAYHMRVRDTLTPDLDAETRAWLEAATAPLAGE